MKLLNAFVITGIVVQGMVYATATPQKFVPIKLNPDIIGLIDGKSFAMSGEVIGASIKICRDINVIQSGKLLSSGEREGRYIYKNKKHCIKTLLPLEIEIEKQLEAAKRENSISSAATIKNLDAELAELHGMLKVIHGDFKKLVDPLMGDAQTSKEPLTILIEEECAARGRQNSLLLDWVKIEADEWDSFDAKVTSLAVFDQFCTDLINFISDLVYNCKKGRAQFEKLVEKYTQAQK